MEIYLVYVYAVIAVVVGQSEPPGDGPPGQSSATIDSVCMDLMLLIDTSCSISEADKTRMVELSKQIIEGLTIASMDNGASVRVGAVTFDRSVHHQFYLGDHLTQEDMVNAIVNIDSTSHTCRTFTHEAVLSALKVYFTPKHGDRNDTMYPNVILTLTDARTIPRRHTPKLKRYVSEAKAEGVEFYIAVYKNNRSHKKHKPPLDVDVLSSSSPIQPGIFFQFDMKTSDSASTEVSRLISRLSMENRCTNVFFTETVCAEIVFVFDVSCSITEEDRELSREVAKDIVRVVWGADQAENKNIRFSALVFDVSARTQFSLDQYNRSQDIIDAIDAINMTSGDCRTMTHKAFVEIVEEHFNERLDRPEPYGNVVVMFYDGMTAPLHLRDRTIKWANAVERETDILESITDIYLVRLENNRGKWHLAQEEFDNIPSSGASITYVWPNTAYPEPMHLTEQNYKDVGINLGHEILNRFMCDTSLLE